MTKYEPNVPYSEELNYFDRGLPPFDDIVQSKENLLYLYDLALTLQKLESFFRKRGESKEKKYPKELLNVESIVEEKVIKVDDSFLQLRIPFALNQSFEIIASASVSSGKRQILRLLV